MGTTSDPNDPALKKIDPVTGMQDKYLVLSPEERAKGYKRPYRDSYVHVGSAPNKYPLQDLTPEQQERTAGQGYVKFEPYPESESPVVGRYWTHAALANVAKGCGALTVMNQAIAETYARDPGYYGGTYCAGCKKHLPVSEFVWDGTDQRVGS